VNPNAVSEVTRERAQSLLTDEHIERIVAGYREFKNEPGFTRVATLEEILAKDYHLSLPLYVRPQNAAGARNGQSGNGDGLREAINAWLESSRKLRKTMERLFKMPDESK